uniref:Thioredoxin a n=1 Tax=Paramormyrops kingsleyae TaxID=1676925 RepID=A0A3B3T3B0_9TELE
MPYKRELDKAQIRLPNFIQERRDLGVQSVFKMIVVIENQEAFDKALRDAGDKLVVVDFTAVWCGPCQSIAPFYKSLSENPDYIQVVFLKVDVDDAQVSRACWLFAIHRSLFPHFVWGRGACLYSLLDASRFAVELSSCEFFRLGSTFGEWPTSGSVVGDGSISGSAAGHWSTSGSMLAGYVRHVSMEDHYKLGCFSLQDVASFCDISCMPTFHFYKNGKKIDDFSGCNQAKLEEKLNNHK